jgi:hypothetical protein
MQRAIVPLHSLSIPLLFISTFIDARKNAGSKTFGSLEDRNSLHLMVQFMNNIEQA